jgi:hypothetical protein
MSPVTPSSQSPQADLWTLALERPTIDPDELAAAIERQVGTGDLDFRTRLLIRDAVRALGEVWGDQRLRQWLDHTAAGPAIRGFVAETSGPAGFPSIQKRLMNHMKPETALQFLRELGASVQQPSRLAVGGSMALILRGLLSRRTGVIDAVDEIGVSIRSELQLLNELTRRYDLRLAHFQSHYLPDGWETRLQSLGRFGSVDVFLVDEHDIAVGKLCSGREKDRDDVRVLAQQLDKHIVADRLRRAGGRLLAEPDNRRNAERNWYIIYGESLPA